MENRYIQIEYSLCSGVPYNCYGTICGFGTQNIWISGFGHPLGGTGGGSGSGSGGTGGSGGTSSGNNDNDHIKPTTTPNNCPECPEFIEDENPLVLTPCGGLKKLSDMTFYTQNIDFLKLKAAGPKEHGWAYKYFPNTTTISPPTVVGHNSKNPNRIYLDAFQGAEWLGAFHNHTNGEQETIKMYSPGDVQWLLVKALTNNNNQPPSVSSNGVSELFLGLVNVNQVYSLKIKDWNKFYLLANTNTYNKFKKDLTKLYEESGGEASQETLQKIFLKAIKELDLGIGLFEQDSNGIWNELILNPTNNDNTPVKIPCP